MTIQELLAACWRAGIILRADGDQLAFDAPAGALTPELRAALVAYKPELLQVLPRLEGMRATVGQVPVPCAVLAATGGPGWCFSCGDSLEHPHAYGRCVPCAIAVEVFYREVPDAADRWQPVSIAPPSQERH